MNIARATGSARTLHCCWPWHWFDTCDVTTRDLQILALYLGDLMGQYTRLEGLLVNTEDTIAILSCGGQEIVKDSP